MLASERARVAFAITPSPIVRRHARDEQLLCTMLALSPLSTATRLAPSVGGDIELSDAMSTELRRVQRDTRHSCIVHGHVA